MKSTQELETSFHYFTGKIIWPPRQIFVNHRNNIFKTVNSLLFTSIYTLKNEAAHPVDSKVTLSMNISTSCSRDSRSLVNSNSFKPSALSCAHSSLFRFTLDTKTYFNEVHREFSVIMFQRNIKLMRVWP